MKRWKYKYIAHYITQHQTLITKIKKIPEPLRHTLHIIGSGAARQGELQRLWGWWHRWGGGGGGHQAQGSLRRPYRRHLQLHFLPRFSGLSSPRIQPIIYTSEPICFTSVARISVQAIWYGLFQLHEFLYIYMSVDAIFFLFFFSFMIFLKKSAVRVFLFTFIVVSWYYFLKLHSFLYK